MVQSRRSSYKRETVFFMPGTDSIKRGIHTQGASLGCIGEALRQVEGLDRKF